MLKSLYISNYILIDEVEIKFNSGFTVITGETGAGKSILINAFNILLGGRVGHSVAANTDKKVIFEAIFEIDIKKFEQFFLENNLDNDAELIIRREILPSGKSRIFINDTPVNMSLLKSLSPLLIDIHSQHQNLLVQNPGFQLSVLDVYADNIPLLDSYKTLYYRYISTKKELDNLNVLKIEAEKNRDYLEYRYQMLEQANLQEGEYEEIEAKIKELSNFETIKTTLGNILYDFYEKEENISTQLNKAVENLQRIKSYLPKAEVWSERLENIEVELNDLLLEISNHNEDLVFDEGEYEKINQRYNELNDLMRKFAIYSETELIKENNRIENELTQIQSYSEVIEQKEKELLELESKLKEIAKKLSKKRLEIIPPITKKIEKIISELGIKNGRIKIDIERKMSFSDTGIDEVSFLFSANTSIEPQPIKNIASGGELSRVMLAIKSVVAEKKGLPTIIFDEIDTGISGEIAAKMANIMKRMSKRIQVIAITHLPQIAAKGDTHLLVKKEDKQNKTYTTVKLLEDNERVKEIAQMISGEKVSDAALQNARNLLGLE